VSVAALVPEATLEQAKAFVNSPLSSEVVEPLVAREGTRTLLSVVTRHGAQSEASDAFVQRLREELPRVLPPGVTADVGGSPGLNVDINTEMQSRIPPVVTLVLVLSFVLLLLFFRSLLLPLKAILMNAASVLAAYGLLVFVFQDGHFEGLLGFESPGHIESFIPLFLFCILFGLSMDYEVFLLARIREEYLRTGDNTEAVGWGLEHTGRIITSAAAVMVTVFGAFAFASLIPIKTMGFGLAVAVLLDATLIRVVLVPAAMRLMGKWNWWLPGWLDRILPKVSVEGAAGPETERQVRAGV
jgi:putative drug exporter of the RND superfamily